MKKFSYYNFAESCPLASKVENAMNDCGSPIRHIEKLNAIFNDKLAMSDFLLACIAYWSECADNYIYDGRNEYAVLSSQKIAEHFDLNAILENVSDEILKNAFGFTMSAHRYLQNELFKAIMEWLKQSESEIAEWYNSMEFIIDRGRMIPYAVYKAEKYGV